MPLSSGALARRAPRPRFVVRHGAIGCVLVSLLCARPGTAQRELARFDPSAVAAFRDSFALVVNGQVAGWHVYAMERTPGGLRFIDRFALGSAMSRGAEVLLDDKLHILRGRHEGMEFGKPVRADVKYTGKRAIGVGLRRTDAGPVQVQVDTVLPDGAFDGLALMGLILTLEWRAGAAYPLGIFDVDEGGSLTTQVLRVADEEVVTVRAGRFRAFRADLTTTQAPVRIWVTAARPHRLLKIGGADESFSTVLVAASP